MSLFGGEGRFRFGASLISNLGGFGFDSLGVELIPAAEN